MGGHEKHTVLILKEEGGGGFYVNQYYDREFIKKYKANMLDDTAALRTWMPETKDVVNSSNLANVCPQALKNL